MILAALPSTTPPLVRITCEKYHSMIRQGVLTEEDRVELIHGYLVSKMSIGSLHSAIRTRLEQLLIRALPTSCIVRGQEPITIHEYSEPEPDIVIAKFREDFYANSHPEPADVLVAIEVADTSLAYDRDAKIPLFASAGIPEAWLVDINAKSITVFTQPDGAGYGQQSVYTSGMSLPLSMVPDAAMNLADLGF